MNNTTRKTRRNNKKTLANIFKLITIFAVMLFIVAVGTLDNNPVISIIIAFVSLAWVSLYTYAMED